MRLLKVIAIIVLFLGLFRLSLGLYVAVVFEGSQSATARYLGSGTSGEAIDQGIYRIILAVMALIIVRLIRKKETI